MKQLRIGSLAHHHAFLRDNFLRLEYQHPSPSVTLSHPDSLLFAQRLPSKNSAPSIRQALPYETFPPPPPPTLTISYRRVFSPPYIATSVEFAGRGGDSEGLWCCKPPSRWRTFLLRSGGSWLLTWYPHDPTTGGLDYHGSAGAFLSPTKSWAVFASALVRVCLKSLYIGTVDDRWTKAVPFAIPTLQLSSGSRMEMFVLPAAAPVVGCVAASPRLSFFMFGADILAL